MMKFARAAAPYRQTHKPASTVRFFYRPLLPFEEAMKPYIYGPKFMWNLDTSVGKLGANSNACDVSFIQWYYVLASNFHLTDADRKAIYRNVKITGSCNGKDDDPLVQAIIAQQQATRHPQVDGKVSVVHGSGKVGSDVAFFLLRIEARLAVMYPKEWPRLDLIPNCPSSVAEVSRFAVPTMNELVH
jgi:hypothetical protein